MGLFAPVSLLHCAEGPAAGFDLSDSVRRCPPEIPAETHVSHSLEIGPHLVQGSVLDHEQGDNRSPKHSDRW